MPEPRKNPMSVRNVEVGFFAGTTMREVNTIARGLICRNNRIALSEFVGRDILFDSDGHPPRDVPLILDSSIDPDRLFSVDEFVLAALPTDEESLVKAEKEGKLCFVEQGWYQNPGVSLENLGASGDPRIGYTLGLINQAILQARFGKRIGQLISHDRPGKLLLAGLDAEGEPACLVVINLYLTTVGGMGNGSVLYLCKKVKAYAIEYGARAKTVLHVLFRGDLPVRDQDQADINEMNFLKTVRAHLTGQYVDPVTGSVQPCPFDLVFLQSNRNCNGRLPSLDRLKAHEAHRLLNLSGRPLGEVIRRRMTDMESWDFDDNGDPHAGFTMAVSYLGWDRQRIIAYCTSLAASVLARKLAGKQETADARQEALVLADMHGVVESEEDYRLTSRITNPEEFKGESVIQRLRSNFVDRTEGTGGLERANVLAETITAISSTDSSSVYEPAMKAEAEKILNKTMEDLASYIRRHLSGHISSEDQTGQLKVLAVLTCYRQIVQGSYEAVTQKSHQIQQFLRPHEDVVNNALEELERVRNRSWLWRFFHPFLPKTIADCLQRSGLVFLECQLQMLMCRIAAQDLLERLMDFLDGKLAELGMLKQNLDHIFALCKQQAERLATRPSTFDIPLGFDLVNESSLNESFGRTVTEHSGPKGFAKDLVTRFLSEHGSLSVLLGKDPDEIEQALKQICWGVFEPVIKQTDVVSEFKKRYPSERTQLRFLRQMVLQSEGRVLTVGELGRPIPWLKCITVPDSDYLDWINGLIQKADPKPGRWEVVVDNNKDAISVVQLRGGISLTPLIASRERDLVKRVGWPKILSRAIDRSVAMMAPPNPDNRKLRRIFAKAFVTGQLCYDSGRGFSLRFSDNDEPVLLGEEGKAAMDTLRRKWPYIVRIESTFAHHVVLDDTAVARRVEHLPVSSGQGSDPRLDLIDDTAVCDVKEQMSLLVPWARRLRVNVGKS